jgi:phosphonopyruvate decarboxylase
MDIDLFLSKLQSLGIEQYFGVPDSQLSPLCDRLYAQYGNHGQHIVAANEGAAVALAAGHYLATGKPALVYMQNSGIGNIVNPVASLLNGAVYAIPSVFVIGWRGEPGVKDEPQHIFQGEITLSLLDVLNIPYFVISKDTTDDDFINYVQQAAEHIEKGEAVAFVIRKNALSSEKSVEYCNDRCLTRENALAVIAGSAGAEDVFVSTTGKASRELYEIRERLDEGHARDFLTVGSMGHASMIATGIALSKPDRRIWCLDGDGAMVMHLGSALVLAKTRCLNLVHVVMNNGAHESVGGMPVAGGQADLTAIARAMGYTECFCVENAEELRRCVTGVHSAKGPIFIEVMISIESRRDLGRPTTTPQENKAAFMRFLSKEVV